MKLLEARGTLDPGAGPTLELYAETKARWLRAKADLEARGEMITETRITKSGETYDVSVLNPMLRVAENCESQLLSLTKTLGIAPDARERVKKVKAAPARGNDNRPQWYIDSLKNKDNGNAGERS